MPIALERMVKILPMIGSMAALASWNSKMQPVISAAGDRIIPLARWRSRSPCWCAGRSTSLMRMRPSANIGRRKDGGRGRTQPDWRQGIRMHHRSRSNAVADRGEAGIAAQPRAECGMADKAQADRGDDGSEHAACRRVQDTGSHHHREIRPDRERKRAQANRRHRECATSRAERTASTSAPPGIWQAKATSPPVVRTSPISNCAH